LLRARLQAQKNRLDAGQQALDLVDKSQKQQAMLSAALERFRFNLVHIQRL